ncbi:MAG TPA: oxygenase MpaB family protein [Chloroflexota bacterium]|nr:oxygenase MpaB family protein [Chloroflexota bacterium]
MTVLQRVNSERVVLLGWGAAILMQLAHPQVAAGVAQHSRFLDTPMARFQRLGRTIKVMQALNFGNPAEVARAARLVNTIHGRVNGSTESFAPGCPAGTPYRALDPRLLLWVLASLLYALPRAYELFVGPLTAEERDRFIRDARPLGVLLGVPEHILPRNTAELDRYLEDMLAGGEVAVGETGERLTRELLRPAWPWFARPLIWLSALPAIGLLPPAVRRAYALPWTTRHRIVLGAMAWLCRRLVRCAPRHWRYWPAALAHLAQNVAPTRG